MKKFLCALCLILMICATMLTGCNLVSRNDVNYYNQIVASAGEVSVTMQELLYGYNSFGYQYVNNENKTTEEAIKQTIEDLLNKKLFLKYFENDDAVALTESEKNYILSQTYLSINNSIKSYELEVKKENGVVEVANPEENEKSGVVYSAYEEPVSYVNNKFVYNVENEPLRTLSTVPVFGFSSTENNLIKNEARSRYFENLRTTAKTLGKKDLSNDALLQDEIKRVYDSLVESALITKINSNYVSFSSNVTTSLNNEIYEYFKNIVNQEKSTLNILKGVSSSSIGSLTVSDVEALKYYCPSIVSQNFFEVVHILIPFDDNYETELAQLEKDVEAGKTDSSSVDNYKTNAFKNISIKARDESGERTGESITPEALLNELTTKFSEAVNSQEKEDIFREYMYKYSSDDTSTKSATNMVIPNNSGLDTMVSEFATECRRLDNAGEEIALSNITTTSYGCHIILYLGDCERVVDENTLVNETNKENLLVKMYDYKLKSGDNKSAYHTIYETIINNINTFDNYYEEKVNFEKDSLANAGKKIVIYTKRIKSLWE